MAEQRRKSNAGAQQKDEMEREPFEEAHVEVQRRLDSSFFGLISLLTIYTSQ